MSSYVCPQCGPAPEGPDAHAERMHTWPQESAEEVIAAFEQGAKLLTAEPLNAQGRPSSIAGMLRLSVVALDQLDRLTGRTSRGAQEDLEKLMVWLKERPKIDRFVYRRVFDE